MREELRLGVSELQVEARRKGAVDLLGQHHPLREVRSHRGWQGTWPSCRGGRAKSSTHHGQAGAGHQPWDAGAADSTGDPARGAPPPAGGVTLECRPLVAQLLGLFSCFDDFRLSRALDFM